MRRKAMMKAFRLLNTNIVRMDHSPYNLVWIMPINSDSFVASLQWVSLFFILNYDHKLLLLAKIAELLIDALIFPYFKRSFTFPTYLGKDDSFKDCPSIRDCEACARIWKTSSCVQVVNLTTHFNETAIFFIMLVIVSASNSGVNKFDRQVCLGITICI